MNVLVIEDDPLIGKALSQGFTEAGHACEWAKNGDRGSSLALSQRFDVVVLDMMLPGRSGKEILDDLRGQGIRCPVVVLTALGSVDERVDGLQRGADDYMVKPFHFSELLARVEAVCRRSADRPSMHVKAGELTLDVSTRRARLGDRDVDLTPTEASMLELFMRYAGQVVTRKMLCEHLWEIDWEGTTNVIEVHVNRLRRKLDRGGNPSLIQTVRGRGYALRVT